MSQENDIIKISQAEDTFDLMNHIAWVGCIKPKLLQRKEYFGKILVASILGAPLPIETTKEMIAGRISGIEEIIVLMEQILREGASALERFKLQGISL